MERCLQEELPPSVELEEGLRNGVFLGKLAHFFSPDLVPLRKIYDKDMKKYKQKGLHFKHTDNINHFFRAMEKVGLPKVCTLFACWFSVTTRLSRCGFAATILPDRVHLCMKNHLVRLFATHLLIGRNDECVLKLSSYCGSLERELPSSFDEIT